MPRKILRTVIGIIGIMAVFGGLYWISYLAKVHNSFENYAAFRGCVSTAKMTATSSNCVLKSGDTLILVKINSKWYLEGDGPGVW